MEVLAGVVWAGVIGGAAVCLALLAFMPTK